MVLFRRLLGDVLREQRMQRGMTLREVSAEARVSLGYISEIERGQKEASSELLASLCAALDVPLSDGAARGLRRGRRRGGRALEPTPITVDPAPRRGRRLRRLTSLPRRPVSRVGLAARAPVRRPLAARGSRASPRDRGAAAPAGRLVAAVDPHPLPLAQVAGGGLLRPLLVELEHLLGPADQPRRSGTSPTGVRGWTPLSEAELGGVHVADAGQAASGRAAPRRAGGRGRRAAGAAPRPRPSPGRAGRGRGGRRRRPRGARRAARRCRARSRPPPGRSVLEHHPRLVWPGAATAGRGVRPARALHLEVGVQGPRLRRRASIRVSRCLPRVTVSTTVAPDRSAVASCGTRKSVRGQHLPGQRPVEQPGGAVDGVTLRHASRRSPAGWRRSRPRRAPRAAGWARSRAAASPSAFSTVSRPSEPRRARLGQRCGGRREQVGVVGPGEQGAAAALDVEGQRAVDQHHQRARLAARAGGRRRRPRRRPGQRGAVGVGRVGGASATATRLGVGRRARLKVRSRSIAPAVPNWAAPRPSTK